MKLKTRELAIIGVLLAAALALYLFGITGLRTLVGMIVLFVIPLFVIINNLKLDTDEKLFFSLFLGLGLFPLLVYWLDRILTSLLLSAISVFVLALVIGFGLKIFIKRP